MKTRMQRAIRTLAVAGAIIGASLFANRGVEAQSTGWYWDDIVSTCIDPCPIYIEGWCWCRVNPPIIIT